MSDASSEARARAEAQLVVHSTAPLNAEPAMDRLVERFHTPQALLYVRSHGEVQQLDAATHRLRVTGRVATPLDLGMDELRARFPSRTVTASLQCAGNRRADLQEVKPTAGDPWQAGAVGNARWTGVALAEVLAAAGAATDAGLQAAFYSADEIEVEGERARFGVSIPMAKALAHEVLLAFEVNGEPLAPEHGFPLRAIVPGYAGVRSAKWLAEVRVQDTPADSPIQRKDYKFFPPDVQKADTARDPSLWDLGLTIDALPLNSAICTPARGARLPPGPLTLSGWATASGRAIVRVDVSVDGGRSWTPAELEQDPAQPHAWTLWRLETQLAPGEHELVVRAFDEALQTQPDTPDDTWNYPGYLAAHRHRIHVTVG